MQRRRRCIIPRRAVPRDLLFAVSRRAVPRDLLFAVSGARRAEIPAVHLLTRAAPPRHRQAGDSR
jgi:hypothetical protein